MTRAQQHVLLRFATAAIVLAAACSGPQTGEVRVGSILGLSGDNATYGQKMQRGFQFAQDERAATASRFPLRLLIEDSQFIPTKAVLAYRKLTGVDGVRIILGITGSKNATQVCETAKSDNVVIIDPLSSSPTLSTACGANYYRIMASDALAGAYNADWAMESGARTFSILYVEDDWGASYKASLVEYLKRKGALGVASYSVVEKTRDFRVQIEGIKKDNPDALFLLVYGRDGSTFMKQLRDARLKTVVYGSDNISSAEFVTTGADVVEGVRVAMPAPAQSQVYQRFVAKYRAKFGEDPDANVIKSYDAFNLAADLIERAGVEPSAIIEALRAPEFRFEGISGVIQFDEHGDLRTQEYSRLTYRAGRLSPVK